MVRPLLITGAALGVSILTVFAGCSSSSSGNGGTGGKEGGTASSSGSSSGASSSSGSSSGGATDSGHKEGSASSSSGSSSGSGDDSGGTSTCPYGTAFTPGTYPASTEHSGACLAADITSFLAACGDSGNSTACGNWQTANVPNGDAGAGTACGACIFKDDNSGASFVSVTPGGHGFFGPNYGGCIQLLDPTNGPACQPAYDAVDDCEVSECGDCADSTTYATCASAVDASVCSTQSAAVKTACAADFADGGTAQQCDPGAATNPPTSNPTFQLIISLICGTADGG
jgi:hypothetical protein